MDQCTSPRPTATVVTPPRAADAIGIALRDVYVRDCSVPNDMMVMLARLNGNGWKRSTGH
jgi:hypothetical protein